MVFHSLMRFSRCLAIVFSLSSMIVRWLATSCNCFNCCSRWLSSWSKAKVSLLCALSSSCAIAAIRFSMSIRICARCFALSLVLMPFCSSVSFLLLSESANSMLVSAASRGSNVFWISSMRAGMVVVSCWQFFFLAASSARCISGDFVPHAAQMASTSSGVCSFSSSKRMSSGVMLTSFARILRWSFASCSGKNRGLVMALNTSSLQSVST